MKENDRLNKLNGWEKAIKMARFNEKYIGEEYEKVN